MNLKENWFKISIAIFIIFALYWLGYRPVQIRKECNNYAKSSALQIIETEQKLIDKNFPIEKRADYNNLFNNEYKNCLLNKGIKN